MKILYIVTQADGGGAQKYVLTLAKHFKGAIAAGTESTQLFTAATRLQLTTYNLHHLKRNISPLHDLLAIFEIRALIKKLKADVVHLNSTKAGLLGSLASVGLKTKVVFTAHGFIFNEPMPAWKKTFYIAVEKFASLFRDFIITVSDADKKSALENSIISKNKIQTVYNGIPQISFKTREQAREHLDLPQNLKIFGVIANKPETHRYIKGIDVIEETSNFLPDNSAIVIIGGTEQTTGINKKFIQLPYEPEVQSLLKAFDLLIIPSRKEGLPYTLLEAMQAGLPVVATRVGGIPVALGDAGLLVEAGNAKALAEAINSLSDEEKCKALSLKAQKRAKLFTEEQMLNNTESVYKKV